MKIVACSEKNTKTGKTKEHSRVGMRIEPKLGFSNFRVEVHPDGLKTRW